MKRRCFSSIVPETPLSVNRKRGFSCISPHFPAFPRIAPRRPPFRGKNDFFSLQTQKCRRGFLKFLPPADLPLPFPASFSFPFSRKFSFPAPPTAGREKSTTPRPNRPSPPTAGKGGRKKEKIRRASQKQKWEGRGQKSAARAVRRKAMRVGKRKKRRETAEAPPKVLGAPLPKKTVAADGKLPERSAINDRFYKKSLRQVRLFTSKILRQARFCSGNREKRAEKAFATGQSLRTQQKSPKRRFGLFLRGRTDADPCKRRLLNALPRGRGFPSPDRRGKSRRCSPETPPFFTVIFTVCHRVF